MPGTSTAAVRQTLSVADAIAIVVGIVVGAGIFETPPLVASNTGSAFAAIAVWCLGGLLSFLGALCYAELATTYPDSGGIYYYIRRAFGDTPAFLLGWARLAVIQTGSIAMLGFVFGDYAAKLAPLGRHSSSIYAALAVVAITMVNIRGVQFGRWTQNLLTICKVAGLLAVVVAGLRMSPAATVATVAAAPGPSHSRFGLMMVFVLLTYGGWQEAGFISAELKQVRRNMTLALMGSIGLITAIYLLVNLALLHGLGLRGVATANAVATELMRGSAGELGATLVSLLVMITALGSLQGTVFTGARTNFALGRDFPIFSRLSEWSASSQTPRASLAIQGAVALVLVAMGTATREGFKTMVEFTAPVFWFFILLSGMALIVLRRREPEIERPFRVPAYPFTPIVFIATSAYLLYASLAYTGLGAMAGVVVLLAGAAVLFASRLRQRFNNSRQPTVEEDS
ncbi:MAG: amino acid permease [Candidatus Korobacteraceae bacterium]|jgi:amino acid transporter